jgi:hypothetical protein
MALDYETYQMAFTNTKFLPFSCVTSAFISVYYPFDQNCKRQEGGPQFPKNIPSSDEGGES